MTYDRLVELFTRDMLVNEYATQFSDSLSYSDADYEQYYQENANTLDEYTITQFVFNATVDTVDADGNTIEMTDDEKAAALDQAKATVFADPRISSVNRNKEIIRLVHEQGIFKMKNAVPKVAQELGVSKNTVYLHLRSLKNADQGEES